MKTNFEKVLFAECNTTPVQIQSRGWLVDSHHVPTRLRHQQGCGEAMSNARLMGRDLAGPWWCENVPWKVYGFSDQPLSWSLISMTMHHLILQGICKGCIWIIGCYGHKKKIKVCPSVLPLSLTLLRTILKQEIYDGGQFLSQRQLWESILSEKKFKQKLNKCKNSEAAIK